MTSLGVTGSELLKLADALPEHNTVLGVDLSERMVELCNSKCLQAKLEHRVSAVAGDACSPPTLDFAGVFSVFGLQQLQPEPEQVHAFPYAHLSSHGLFMPQLAFISAIMQCTWTCVSPCSLRLHGVLLTLPTVPMAPRPSTQLG
jgi:hypothetical protein